MLVGAPLDAASFAPVADRLVEVSCEPELGVREELGALAAAERQCSSFMAWEVSQDQVTSSCASRPTRRAPDDAAAIAALFEAA